MKSFKNFAGLGAVVIINLALQFLFQWYIITSLGAGTQTDALFGAMALPQFILVVLSGTLTMVLIPLIAKYTGDEFIKESWNYFQAVALLFTGIAVILLLTAHWWISWILPGFKGTDYQLTLNLVRIQLIGMVCSALLSVVWAIHSARGNFFVIEYTSIAVNIFAFLLVTVCIKPWGVYAVAWVNVIKIILQVALLMKIMGTYHRPDFYSPSFKITWKKLRPLISGNAYYKSDALVDRYLTSRGAAGELTLLNLAQQIYIAGNSILVKVLVNTMIPEMSKAISAGNEKRYNHLFRKRLVISFACTGISFLAMLLLGRWVLGFIFAFKKFTPDHVDQLWWLMVLLAGYLIGGLAGNVTSGTFYAKGDTVTPTRIGGLLFTLYIPVKIFCYFRFGVFGLAISISVYYMVSMLMQLFFLRKHL